MASEKFRQREVYRYYQAWLDSSVGFDTSPADESVRHHGDGTQLRASKDRALIAFAQLGCLRLNAKRGIVTLIGTDQQYILAEATRTLSLVSSVGDVDAEDGLWFGNASLPRSQGISGDALFPPDYIAVADNGASWTAPALVVNDITLHEKYCHLGVAGNGVTFYCGVPLITDSGIPIGVYTITDDQPRHGLTPPELAFMHDMAATVMRHLYIVSQEAARYRGETMILGLGRFISGATTLRDDLTPSSQPVSQFVSPTPTVSEDDPVRLFKGMTITDANPIKLRWTSDQSKLAKHQPATHVRPLAQPSAQVPLNKTLADPRPDLHVIAVEHEKQGPRPPARPPLTTRKSAQSFAQDENVFYRAARILQECVGADGVLFFDAVSTNFAKKNKVPGFGTSEDRTSSARTSHEHQVLPLTEAPQLSAMINDNTVFWSGGSDESDLSAHNEEERRMCKLLGYALEESNLITTDQDFLGDVRMTERNIRRLIKMYPQGKLFSYHTNVGFLASDGDHLTDDVDMSQSHGTDRSERVLSADKSKRIPRAITDELERLVPNAQSIVWLPIWDFSKQRWSSGLFLWSQRSDKLVAAQDDLVYLKAFANSIMVEVARLETLMADTAKSTFIANVSHELRTPLHGVLGNLDILQESDLNDFQHEVAAAIEVCGRTLSDTIDHILDYSKINRLTRGNRTRKQSTSLPLSSLSPDPTNHGKILTEGETFDLAAIVEEAVESACASYAFQSGDHAKSRAQLNVIKQKSKLRPTSPMRDQRVYVTLNIECRDTWLVHSQSSAIRRVITNLFGNALKYTNSGSIEVTLVSPDPANSETKDSGIPVLLCIKDTGTGMSLHFLRNYAFMPFRQESQFSTGTGLGLSIVQQIVRSLRGNIELQSDQGRGTEIKVFLNLPVGHETSQAPGKTKSPNRDKARRPRFDFCATVLTAEGTNGNQISPGLLSMISSLETILRSWLNIPIVATDHVKHPQIDLIVYATPPSNEQLQEIALSSFCTIKTRFLVVASNMMEKARLINMYSDLLTYEGLYIEVLSTPIGPSKLTRAISRLRESVDSEVQSRENKANEVKDSASSKLSYPTTAIVHNRTLSKSDSEHVSKVASSEAMAQRITAKSEAEGGSKHEKHLPLPKVIPEDSASAPENMTQHRPTGGHARSVSTPRLQPTTNGEGSTPSPWHVLLVDDNDINLNILKACMKRAKLPYDFAKDGLQARNKFEEVFNTERRFTHILMDISMPVMDGIQATRQIRDIEQGKGKPLRVSPVPQQSGLTSIPSAELKLGGAENDSERAGVMIIALSGVVSEMIQHEMLEAGADLFLSKPAKMKELLKIIET